MLDIWKPTLARSFLSGLSQYLLGGTPPVTNYPITLAAWGYAGVLGTNKTLVSIDSGGSPSRFTLGLNTSDQISAVTVNGGATSASGITSATVKASTWFHAAAVFASTTSRTAALNGVLGTTDTTSNAPNAPTEVAVGRASSGTTNYMNGQIAWPAIWNVALSAADIAALAGGAHPDTVRPESRVQFWEWTGAQTEFGRDPAYSLANNGSTLVSGPGFLVTRLGRRPALRKPSSGATPADLLGLACSLFGALSLPSAAGVSSGASAVALAVSGAATGSGAMAGNGTAAMAAAAAIAAAANAAGMSSEITSAAGQASAAGIIPSGTSSVIFACAGNISAAGIATAAYGAASFVFSAAGFADASTAISLVYVDAMSDGLNRIGAVAMGVDL